MGEDAQDILNEASEDEDGYVEIKKKDGDDGYKVIKPSAQKSKPKIKKKRVEKVPKKSKKEPERKPVSTGMVKSAVSDLDREIGRIRREKSELNTELKSLDKSLDNAKQLEKKLQDKIAKLENQENDLIDQKKGLRQKDSNLSERLSKVKALKDQLSDI